MKPRKNVILMLFLLIGTILCLPSCEKYRIPTGKSYKSIIVVNSAASACGVDSCVIDIPWIKNEINVFLADSADRKLKFETTLKITQYLCADNVAENDEITYFEFCMFDEKQNGTLWLDCNGDTIWIDPDYINTETHPYHEKTIHILEIV